jgi:putative DNA methylase
MRDEAVKRIGHLYPKVKITKKITKDRSDLTDYVGQELTVMAWLWARTVTCPNPACRLTLPLIKSYALCTKTGRPKRLQVHVDSAETRVSFAIEDGKALGREGTVSRSGAKCIACNTSVPFSYVREEGRAGRLADQLLAVICDGPHGRVYLPALPEHEAAARRACPAWRPEIDIPNNPFSLRPPLYGLSQFADLFTLRQLAALNEYSNLVAELGKELAKSADPAYVSAIRVYAGLNVSRLANRCSNACFWDPAGENIQQVFARQAIAMAWDFVEANPLGDASGSFLNQVDYLANVVASLPDPVIPGDACQSDAADLAKSGFSGVISTDPPYYDNIDYADLSDFFYVWLRRTLAHEYPSLFGTVLVPKTAELVATPYRFNGDRDAADQHFRAGLIRVLKGICERNTPAVPATIIYAFKQAEEEEDGRASTGWESFLQGAVDVGLTISGTWPLRTELVGNLKGQMNALASSIVLACRARRADAPVTTRKDFIAVLRRELPNSLRDLQHGSVAPVDLAQAAIGPGMAVFTRYAKIMETDGSAMAVRSALSLINQTLDEVLAEQEGEFDGDTRWALAWFDQYGVDEGPFGVAETLSKAKNTAVNGLVEAGVILAKAGKVRLVARDELPEDWDPATDKRLTVWEITQHLIRKLEQEGESAAAALVHALGGKAETARDLAYRLYNLCERKKWTDEALAYNGLVIAWPELTKLAMVERSRSSDQQTKLDF